MIEHEYSGFVFVIRLFQQSAYSCVFVSGARIMHDPGPEQHQGRRHMIQLCYPIWWLRP